MLNQQHQTFLDFQKYAKFICEKFDVTVELESVKAETDGRTIYLPNVLSLTHKELDMMYAILLHEAGHIRYSTFDAEYFSSFKTQAHALLGNSIEDARIENLLIKDFGGAQNMFEDLYCNHTQDKELMKKIFKHDGTKPDFFTGFSFFIHNQLSQFRTAELQEIVGKPLSRKIIRFCQEHKIDEILQTHPLKTPSDVLALSNALYKILTKEVKDKSQTINFNDLSKQQKQIDSAFEKMDSIAQKAQEQILENTQRINEINEEIKQFQTTHSEEFNKLESAIAEKTAQFQDIEHLENLVRQKENSDNALQGLENHSNKLQQQINSTTQEINELLTKQSAGLNGRGKPFTDNQKTSLENKIAQKREQLEKKQKAAQDNQASIQTMKEQNKTQQEMLKDAFLNQPVQSLEQLQEQKQQALDELTQLNTEFNELQGKISDLQHSIDKLNEKNANIQENSMNQISSCLIEAQKGAEAFGVDILPPMNNQDSWPEAASEQERFDERATQATGKIVRNGQKNAGLFGTNLRDITTYIDKQKEKVAAINIADIFKDKIGISKLDSFNSETKRTNSDDKSVVGTFGTSREHIPLTTIFDSIKKETTSNKTQELQATTVANQDFYKNLERVVTKRFKFAKKDFWRGGQEEGQFDTRNLWKLPAKQGDDYYEINNPRHVNRLAVSILVDVSGSQDKEATNYGEKLRTLVLGLSKAFDAAHIKHEVLGYHAPVCDEMRAMEASPIYTRRSNKLETIIYKTSDQKDKLGIMNIETHMTDNSDGESLRVALKRVKSIRAKSHAIFIISDGKPFLSDADISVLDEDFRSALRLCVQNKVHIYGIGFFEQLKEFLGEKFCNASDYKNVLEFLNKVSL